MMVFLWRRKSAELRVRCVSFLHLRSRRAEKRLFPFISAESVIHTHAHKINSSNVRNKENQV